MILVTPVTDDERLFRCVWHSSGEGQSGLYVTQPDGSVRFSSQAFNDRWQRPSVDRASLCGYDPTWTQKKPSAGVTAVSAGKVRLLGPFEQNGGGNTVEKIAVDIEHKPIQDSPEVPDNPAHAEIYTDPACNRSVFHRVKEALARLADEAGWIIQPG